MLLHSATYAKNSPKKLLLIQRTRLMREQFLSVLGLGENKLLAL